MVLRVIPPQNALQIAALLAIHKTTVHFAKISSDCYWKTKEVSGAVYAELRDPPKAHF